MTMTGLWVVLGSLIFGVGWFLIEHYLDERKTLRSIQRPKQRSAEEIALDMRRRKHDTMRRMRDVARNYRRP
ncbi:hypothetical protein GCM10023084_54010 [Streptomyces lacrimifluminis]|uniref:Uncharacterized protein n=1 Tax=Streptomyces lacrimifluminis TaxID=1500077 RepID=A0A917KYN1_9ACTN|nr:hypothetical protein [Streptomyces lacrimifluminis]GGJ34342.1 hypothetical protein GCM10012282_33850 [Streptomyces lacrimifluminis]